MNKVYSGYEIELNKEEDKAYKAKILKIEGNSYQETRDEVAGTTVSGDFISISDAQDLPITKFNIEGKSVQETREGYNHFNAGNLKLTNTTQMSQNWQNDVLTVTSAGLPFALASQNITDLVKNNPGKTLTFDFEEITFTQIDVTKSSPIQMNIYFSDGTATKYYGIVDYQKIKHPYTIPTDTSNISSVLICVYSWNGTGNDSEFTTTVKKPMLYLGTEGKEYERYGKTPSIEFETPLESVGDNINLLNFSNYIKNNLPNIEVTQNNDMSIVLNGTTDAYGGDIRCVYEKPITLKAGNYTFGYGVNGVNMFNNELNISSLGNGTYLVVKKMAGSFTETTITFDEDFELYNYNIHLQPNTTFEDFVIYPKICKGTSTGAYSPYGQGSVEIYNGNKNLFDKNTTTENVYIVSATGKTGTSSVTSLSDYIKIKANENYILSYKYETLQNTSQRGIVFYDENKTYLSGYDYKPSNKEVTIIPEQNGYLRFCYDNNCTNIQLEKSSTATEYIEGKSQTKALYTQQPFGAVGDVKDRFIKKAGVWYEEHNYNTKLITGDEAWIYVESTKTWYVETFFTDKLSASEIKSTHYPCMLASQTADMQDGYMAGNKGTSAVNRIYLKDLQNAPVTLAEFKPWIKNLNIVIYYQLNTPLLIPCTPEQVEVLESMRTYEGVNHIYTTDELKPTITFRYNYIPALPSLDAESSTISTGDNINLFNIGTITENHYLNQGNGTLGSSTSSNVSDYIPVIANETYVVSYDYETLVASGKRGYCYFDKNKNYLKGSEYTSSNKTFTLTPTEDGYIRFAYDKNCYDIKLSKGTKSTPYSPYGQGSIEIKQNNENLLDLTNGRNGNYAGITSIKREDGSYTFEGTATGLAINIWYLGVYSSKEDTPVLFTLQPGTYYIKDCKLYNKTTHIGGNEHGQIKTFTKPQNVTAVRARDAVSGETYNEIVYPMIVRSNIPVDFVPHQSQTRRLYTQQPFRRNGEVSDLFIKKEYRWYEQHNIKRKIFDGTESWSMNYGENLFSHGKLNDQNTKNLGSSNYFKFDNRVSAMSGLENNEFALQPQYNGIFFKNTEISSVEEWIAVLVKLNEEGRPLYVDYVLAEPELIPCTPQQSTILDQLENIQLYDGVNYIYTTDDIQPLLTLELYNMIKDYDLYVSNDGYFGIPGTDIKFLVNFYESNLPTMPEAVEASVRAAGRDGDYVLNTTYEPLPFEIVCYTEDNLTPTQKKEIESKVNRFLNSIKNRTKRIAFEKGEKFYNVKYNGLLTTTNYPAHLKFSIPLKSSESFGKDAYQKVLSGNSTEVSDTVEEVGALITIYGPATLPIIALNDYSMEYDTAILEGARIEIDTAKSTATHINSDGVKTNVMRYYNHQFPKIQPGENTLKVLSGVDDENNVTVKWNDLKL